VRRRCAALLLVGALGVAACESSDSEQDPLGTVTTVATSEPIETVETAAGPFETGPPPTAALGVEPTGFTTVAGTITAADGTVCEVCLWLADTPERRGRGLMGVTSLGNADGMVFVFEQPTEGAFYMFRTPTPLSIAWFGADGAYVGAADMAPCLDAEPGECPLYSPGAPYRYALEVFAPPPDDRVGGGLDALGASPGSTLELHSSPCA
jgi:hypothetical protein